MGKNVRQQLRIATGQPALKLNTFVQEVAFYDVNGNPVNLGTPAAFVAQITTPNATDLATAQALANQLKTTVNSTLTALKNAGLMAPS